MKTWLRLTIDRADNDRSLPCYSVLQDHDETIRLVNGRVDVPDDVRARRYRTVVVCRLQRIERGTKTSNELLEAFGKVVGVETVFVDPSFDSVSAALE